MKIHIDESVQVPWGQIRVQCNIPSGDSLEPNLKAVIHAHAVNCGPKDKGALEKVLAINFENLTHLNVQFIPGVQPSPAT